jgi:hypothetical protein
MTRKTYRVTRELTTFEREGADEIAQHTDRAPIQVGDIVHEFTGFTYGCIRHPDIAVSYSTGDGPFFPVPRDAVDEVSEHDSPAPEPGGEPA